MSKRAEEFVNKWIVWEEDDYEVLIGLMKDPYRIMFRQIENARDGSVYLKNQLLREITQCEEATKQEVFQSPWPSPIADFELDALRHSIVELDARLFTGGTISNENEWIQVGVDPSKLLRQIDHLQRIVHDAAQDPQATEMVELARRCRREGAEEMKKQILQRVKRQCTEYEYEVIDDVENPFKEKADVCD